MSAWTAPPSAADRPPPRVRPARPARPAAAVHRQPADSTGVERAAVPDRAAAGRAQPAVPRGDSPPPPARTRRHLPAGARLADRRGLTALGAIVTALLLGAVGAVVDPSGGRDLHPVFAGCFLLGCAAAAAAAHREDLRIALSLPPLGYVALVAAATPAAAAPGSFVKTEVLPVLSDAITGAPLMFAASAATAVIVALRGVTGRAR